MFKTLGERARILVADDEPEIRHVLSDLLSPLYDCDAVGSAEEAVECLRGGAYDLVISDIMMGGMSGLDLIPRVKELSPDTVVIMISGVQTVESAINALRAGAFDYVMKPFDLHHVEAAVSRALEHHYLRAEKRRYETFLEEMVAQRTQELDGALRSLEFGSLLHDIGKIGVPDAILRKPAKLSDEEWVRMREHPLHGQKILRGIEFLEGASRVVAQHHERWDGSGYPLGLRGEEIDLNARIFAVADAFDAITSDRVYRAGRSYDEALAELDGHAGLQFDPRVVEAFRHVPREEWDEIRRRSLEARERIATARRVEQAAGHIYASTGANALVN